MQYPTLTQVRFMTNQELIDTVLADTPSFAAEELARRVQEMDVTPDELDNLREERDGWKDDANGYLESLDASESRVSELEQVLRDILTILNDPYMSSAESVRQAITLIDEIDP